VNEDRAESGRAERRGGGKIMKRSEGGGGDNERWTKGEERMAGPKGRGPSRVRDKMANAGGGTDLDDHGGRRKKFPRIKASIVPPTRPAKESNHATRPRCCFRARSALDGCRSAAACWTDSATASRTSCSTS
jgi:hypothetical protein